jgi:hypothetical protein
MTGRIVHADVPHRAQPLERALLPVWLLGNAAVYAAIAGPARSMRLAWCPSPAVPASARTEGPIAYVAWHRYNFASTHALAQLPDRLRPTLVMHDGLTSRALTHEASAWFGFETFVFRRRSPVPPRAQIVDYVRASGRSIAILPDAGGPYGRVKPGMMQVAAEAGAWVQPFVVHVDRALVLGRRLRHVVPLPRAHVELRWGEPLPPDAGAAACQAALEALDAA